MPVASTSKPSSCELPEIPPIQKMWIQWPVMIAMLPPLMTLVFGGTVQEWTERFMLPVICIYLYGLISGLCACALFSFYSLTCLSSALANVQQRSEFFVVFCGVGGAVDGNGVVEDVVEVASQFANRHPISAHSLLAHRLSTANPSFNCGQEMALAHLAATTPF